MECFKDKNTSSNPIPFPSGVGHDRRTELELPLVGNTSPWSCRTDIVSLAKVKSSFSSILQQWIKFQLSIVYSYQDYLSMIHSLCYSGLQVISSGLTICQRTFFVGFLVACSLNCTAASIRFRPPRDDIYPRVLPLEGLKQRPPLRAALCFFGLTRSLRHVYFSHATHIIQPLLDAGFAVDKFLHTYNLTSLSNARSEEADVKLDTSEYVLLEPLKGVTITDQSSVYQYFNVSSLVVKHDGEVHDPWNDGLRSLKNMVFQLHSLEMVTNLWLDSGVEYDLVVYTRPDVLFLKGISADMLLLWSFSRNRKQLLWCVPDFDTFLRGSIVNDRFAFGDAKSMSVWGKRIQFVHSFIRETGLSVHAERLVAHAARMMNISVVPMDLRFVRVRADGKVSTKPDQRRFRKWGVRGLLHVAQGSNIRSLRR